MNKNENEKQEVNEKIEIVADQILEEIDAGTLTLNSQQQASVTQPSDVSSEKGNMRFTESF